MKKIIRLTERDLSRIVRRVIRENDLGMTQQGENVYKQKFENLLEEVIDFVGDSEQVYSGLFGYLDQRYEDYKYDKMEESRNTWEDDTDNMVNETSLIHRIQYAKQIKDAKKQSKENDECMCVVETIVSGVIVKPCSDLTSTEEDHIIYNTDNCDTFDGTY
jgi:hypothetical protein